MSRESCIQHRPHNRMAIVREDYFELTGDAVAAALLNFFEYRANAALANEAEPENLPSAYVGPISTAEFEAALLGLSTDKQIRKRLAYLKEQGLISCPRDGAGKVPTYSVEIAKIQQALGRKTKLPKFAQTTSVKQPRSNNLGQTTELPRSNDRTNLGHLTELPRSNDRISLYKNQEEQEKKLDPPLTPQAKSEPKDGGGRTENHGADIRRIESRFNPEPEPPWVMGKQGYRRTYDQGFRKHLVGYLSGLTCNKDKTITVADSDTWLNAANFPERPEGQKRLADAYVRWDDYQTRQAAPPDQAIARNADLAQQAITAELARQHIAQELAS